MQNDGQILQSSLLERYGLSSLQTLHNRISALREKGLFVEPIKEGRNTFLKQHEVEWLDKLNEYLKTPGASLAKYDPSAPLPPTHPVEAIEAKSLEPLDVSPGGEMVRLSEVVGLIEAIVYIVGGRPDPLSHHEILQRAVDKNFLLPTSEVKRLIGVKPRMTKGSEGYIWGGFQFVRVGRAGREASWRVRKND